MSSKLIFFALVGLIGPALVSWWVMECLLALAVDTRLAYVFGR